MGVAGSGGGDPSGIPKWMLVGIPKYNFAPIRIVAVPERDPATGKLMGKYTVSLPGVKPKAPATTEWLELKVEEKNIEMYIKHKQQVFAIQEFLKPGFSETY